MGVLVSEDVLLDTVALWGLVFANSKYHGPVVEAVTDFTLNLNISEYF